jgi:hypothetical protein
VNEFTEQIRRLGPLRTEAAPKAAMAA